MQQHIGVLEDGLQPLGVGEEVGGDVALVEAHAAGELEFQAKGVGLLDGDDAFLATLSIASAIIAPITVSPAEMEAVAAICSLVSTSLASLASSSLTRSTAT